MLWFQNLFPCLFPFFQYLFPFFPGPWSPALHPQILAFAHQACQSFCYFHLSHSNPIHSSWNPAYTQAFRNQLQFSSHTFHVWHGVTLCSYALGKIISESVHFKWPRQYSVTQLSFLLQQPVKSRLTFFPLSWHLLASFSEATWTAFLWCLFMSWTLGELCLFWPQLDAEESGSPRIWTSHQTLTLTGPCHWGKLINLSVPQVVYLFICPWKIH